MKRLRPPAAPRLLHAVVMGGSLAPTCHLVQTCSCRPMPLVDVLEPSRVILLHRTVQPTTKEEP